MTKIKDLTGKTFGRIEVLEYVGIEDHKAQWRCRCSCGNEFITKGIYLTTGDTQSCGCLLKEKERENGKTIGKRNLSNFVDTVRQSSGESAKKHLYYLYKYRAEKKGINFELTLEQFSEITKKSCFYCGAEPSQEKVYKKAYGTYVYNGIDRRDNNLGYTAKNSVPCCKHCNTAKMTMTEDEFADWVHRVYFKFAAYRKFRQGVYVEIQRDGTADWWHKELEEQGISK